MMNRTARVALFDGIFWRSYDSTGPVMCVPSAITSIETPYVYDPAETCPTSPAEQTHGPWNKDEQRYEDGCKSGDQHTPTSPGEGRTKEAAHPEG